MKDFEKRIETSAPDLPSENRELGEKIYNCYCNKTGEKRRIFLLHPTFTSLSLASLIIFTFIVTLIIPNSHSGANNSTSISKVDIDSNKLEDKFPGIETHDSYIEYLAQDPYNSNEALPNHNFYELISFNSNANPGSELGTYEISFNVDEENDYYLIAYCPQDLADEIYEEYKIVYGANPASPTNIVDGSIVNWATIANKKSELKWFKYDLNSEIYCKYEDYLVVGVYLITRVNIIDELVSEQIINKTLPYFESIEFENDGGEILIKRNEPRIGNYLIIAFIDTIQNATRYESKFIYSKYYELDGDVLKITGLEGELILAEFPEFQSAISNIEPSYTSFNYLQFLEIVRELAGDSSAGAK